MSDSIPQQEQEQYWEARYQEANTPWNKGFAAPPLLEFLAKHPMSGNVLIPGCGPGHDVRAIASQKGFGEKVYPEVYPLGTDITPSAIELCKSVEPVGKERYEQSDFMDLPEHYIGAFDWMWEHTLLCAIPLELRDTYTESVANVVKPGGYFGAVFYIDPGDDDGPPYPVSKGELDDRFLPYFELLDEWVPETAFEGRERRELLRLMKRKA